MRFKSLFIILLILSVLCVAVACNDNSDTQTAEEQNPTDQNQSGGVTTPETPSGDGQDDDGQGGGSENPVVPYESDGTFYYAANSEGYTLVSAVDPELNVADIPGSFNSKPVTEIGSEAFRLSNDLMDVSVPASVKIIGDRAFSLCRNLTAVTFESGSILTSLGAGAFRAAEKLQSVVLPDSLQTVGDDCFNEAVALASVSGGSNIIRIGRDAFDNTAFMNKQYETPGIIVIGKTAYDYAEVSGGSPSATCDVYAGVVSVADGAFEDKDTILTVKISSTVTYIGEGAFAYCDNIRTIEVDPANAVYYSEDNAILEKTDGGVRLLRGVGSVPEDVTEIAPKAFSGSAAVTAAVLPDSVIYLGKEAFAECLNLTTVRLSEGLTRLEESVFSGATALENVTVSSGIRDIAGTAFSGCTALKTVTLDSPFVIEAADMSMSAGHLLQWAETVYIPKAKTDAELTEAIKKLSEELSGEELELAIEKLETYNYNLRNATSAFLAASFTESAAPDPDMPGYRMFGRN